MMANQQTRTLPKMDSLSVAGAEIAVSDGTVSFSGVLSIRTPSETVTPYLRQIHSAALTAGVKKLTVDLVQLRFMNSSSIRALVDWVEWIRREPEGRRYVLHFLAKRDVTWQNTTLSAIQCFGGEHVVIERA